jgi:type IV pilus assembly protein PilW
MKKQLVHSSSRAYSKGLTLIEMLVAMTIGMIVIISVVAMFSGATGASRTAEAQGRMNEDAHAALSILTQQIRMAGSNVKQPNYSAATPRNPVFDATTYILRGCEGKFTNISAAANVQSLTCTAGTSTLPDSIAVSYEADRYNTIPTPSTFLPTDCNGNQLPTVTASVTTVTTVPGATGTVTTSANFHIADNRFYVGTTTNVVAPSLFCQGNTATTAQPVVENIEDLQFVYGTAPAATLSGTVAGYLDANGVETNSDSTVGGTALAGLPSSAARWARVSTVRICVLARSEQPVATTYAQYLDCSGTLKTPTDLRLRKAYSTTVVLRNRK